MGRLYYNKGILSCNRTCALIMSQTKIWPFRGGICQKINHLRKVHNVAPSNLDFIEDFVIPQENTDRKW